MDQLRIDPANAIRQIGQAMRGAGNALAPSSSNSSPTASTISTLSVAARHRGTNQPAINVAPTQAITGREVTPYSNH